MKKNYFYLLLGIIGIHFISCSKQNKFVKEENTLRNSTPNCQISTFTDLMNMGKTYNKATDYCVLQNDIIIPANTVWIPINGFTGKLDGQGFTIKGFNINKPSDNNLGLFGTITGTRALNVILQNIFFEAPSVIGNNRVGILVGSGTYVQLENIRITNGNLNGNSDAGGIAGRLNTGVIRKSKFEGDIIGNSNNIGGLTGSISLSSVITESFANVNLQTSGSNNGGLVGYVKQSSVDNSYAIGQMQIQDDFAGGLIGTSYAGQISYSYANISIIQMRKNRDYNLLGGFIGNGDSTTTVIGGYYSNELGLGGSFGQAITFESNNFQGFSTTTWLLPSQGNPSLKFFN